MAIVVRNRRKHRIVQQGTKGLAESLLVGPANGCNKFTIKHIILSPNAIMAKENVTKVTVYIVTSGNPAFASALEGFEILARGDAIILYNGDICHLINTSNTVSAALLRISEQ